MLLFYCKCLSEDLTFLSAWTGTLCFFPKCLSERTSWSLSGLNPMILFPSVCLRGFFWFLSAWPGTRRFFSANVCLRRPLNVYLNWTLCFFPASVCLRGSNDVCLNWSNVSFQVSVWSDQLMYVWTEPCVSFCQRLSEGFNQCLPLAGAQCFFFCKCLSRGDQWMSFWTEPKSFFLC